METFPLMGPFVCDGVLSGDVHAGEIYHVDRNEWGGSITTPIGRYFAWKDPGDVKISILIGESIASFEFIPWRQTLCRSGRPS
jgi:hypothetical protein